MKDMIPELFYLATSEMEESPRYREVSLALEQCRTQIESALGAEFVEEAARLEFERYSIEALLCFRAGFRTAVQLFKA